MIEYHKPPFKLREIKMEVTHRCNLACIHCSSNASMHSTNEMDESYCVRIIEESIEMGVNEIAFSGGEPLLWWPSLKNAVELANKGNQRIFVYTSGNVHKFSEKLSSLADQGLAVIIFSLFSAANEMHDEITGINGSFDKTLEGAKTASKIGLKAEVHFVPMACNYKELKPIANLTQEYGISRISVLRLVPQGRGKAIEGQLLTHAQNIELKNDIQNLRKTGFDIRTGSPYNFLMLNSQPKCCAGIDRITIGPNLKLFPCDAFKHIKVEEIIENDQYSSLSDMSLKQCWENSSYLQAVRKYLSTPFSKKCSSCEAFQQCLSGCMAQKFIESGSLIKRPDPMCLMGYN